MTETVLTEVRGRTLLITLNRPEARNAFNMELAEQLAAACDQLDDDPELLVGVLTGSGRGFSAGMDLKAFLTDGMPSVGDRGFGGISQRGPKKPLIAAVEGFALAGGLEIAMSCDIIVAGKGAVFGIPETGVGLFAAAGGLLRLPRALPYGLAMKLALTAEPIDAEVAHQYGLVTDLAEKGGAVEMALALAETNIKERAAWSDCVKSGGARAAGAVPKPSSSTTKRAITRPCSIPKMRSKGRPRLLRSEPRSGPGVSRSPLSTAATLAFVIRPRWHEATEQLAIMRGELVHQIEVQGVPLSFVYRVQ